MAIDAQMYFKDYQGAYLASEAQMEFAGSQTQSIITPFKDAYNANQWIGGATVSKTGARRCGLFEIEDYSFDIEQILSIGSQSSGSGAGKVTFNPFSITRKIDCSSPMFFSMACSGTPFAQVGLGLRKSAGASSSGGTSGLMYLAFTFALVAVKTLAWAHDDEAPKETVTFEYGGLNIDYWQQAPDGSLVHAPQKGWNRVKNIAADTLETLKIV
jgi:type VI protein secretion system component Hcp